MPLHDHRTPDDRRSLDSVDFGPGVGAEVDRRLLGEVTGRRILDLGCGQGHTAVGLAVRGARVIAIDDDVTQLGTARALAAAHEVTIEFHQARPAELAFLPADHVEVALAITSLSFVDDLDRVFRQVHRVVRPGGHFVIAVPHPATLTADPADPGRTVTPWEHHQAIGDRWLHTAESLTSSLTRANFAVDQLLERRDQDLVPATLVIRARKLGI
ncbi:MAG: class I SAM-dependent methyltransferase [Acidimicrobiales bacterium]